ncbi:MAG TPA: STAS/SEC14 domain-containing protein [Kiritimatiellia bacterium]|nr:STAS/SEC14 domain-containing protein [Kiritimatiellia bacterium]
MPHFLQQLDAFTLATTISGVMSLDDLRAIQAASREVIEREGRMRALVILRDYRGFQAGADWGDIGFAAEYGDRIERMAIVGDVRWEAEALAFTGKGARRTDIEYFPLAEFSAAQAWLNRP